MRLKNLMIHALLGMIVSAPSCSSQKKTDKVLKNLNSVGISGVSGPRLNSSETDYFYVTPDTFEVGQEVELHLTYELGRRPLKPGDTIHIQFPVAGEQEATSPLMWSVPQTQDPGLPGFFTLLSGDPKKLDIRITGFNWLRGVVYIKVKEEIPPSRKLVFSYRGNVQLIARSFRFKCYRNGRLLNNLPEVVVQPRRATHILAVLPSVVKAGERARISLVALDRYGNLDRDYDGVLKLGSTDPGCEGLPSRYQFSAGDSGTALLDGVIFHGLGFQRITVSLGETQLRSNYCLVTDRRPESRIYYGDLQFHSGTVTDTIIYGLGDHQGGYNSEEASYSYLRDVMRMDFAAATEHAYHREFMDEVWRRSNEISSQFYNPGSFTTFYGFEWHSNEFGHRVILYPEAGEPYFSNSDPETDSIDGLWESLKGRDSIIIPHPMQRKQHGRIHPIWQRTNNQLERLGEIYSNKTLKGTIEPDNMQNFETNEDETASMQYAWKTGHLVGVVAGSDDHLGHPGLDNFSEYIVDSGGITGVWAERNDREAIWKSLKGRHSYATSGPRIYLELRVDDHLMGDIIAIDKSGKVTVQVRVAGTAPLEKVEIVHFDGDRFSCFDIPEGMGEDTCEFKFQISVEEGQLLYLRVLQRDGEMAWSSPIWFEPTKRSH